MSLRWAWVIACVVLFGVVGETWGKEHLIALVSDPHVSLKAEEQRYVRHFEKVIDEVNASGAEAVVIAGDVTQSGSAEQVAKFTEMVKGFHAPVVRWVPGNHDVGNKVMEGKTTSMTAARVARYEAGLGPVFWSAGVCDGVRVVGVCSSLLGSGLEKEAEQWAFLEKELPAKKAGEVVLVLTHYPPFVNRAAEADEYFNMNLGVRERFVKVLEGAGVRTILSGHLHRPVDYEIDDGKIHVIGAPAVSFGLPKGVQREGWKLVTVKDDGTCVGELRYLEREKGEVGTTAPAATTRAGAAKGE